MRERLKIEILLILSVLVFTGFAKAQESKLNLLWKYETEDVIELDISSENKRIMVATKDNLTLLDKNGNILWRREIPSISSASMSSNGEFFSCGLTSGKVLLLNEKGEVLWEKRQVTGLISSTKVTSKGTVLFASLNQMVSEIKKNGVFLKDKKMLRIPMLVDISEDSRSVVVATNDDVVHFLDDTLVQYSAYTAEGEIKTMDMSSGGEYLAVGVENLIVLLDDESEVLWKYETNSLVNSVDISSTGLILYGAESGYGVLDIKGKVLWRKESKKGVLSVDISEDGKFILIHSKGYVYLYEVVESSAMDVTPPRVEITSPLLKEISGEVKIDAKIDDIDAKISVRIDSMEVSDSLPYIWNTEEYDEGEHLIEVIATDSFGNMGMDSKLVSIEKLEIPEGELEEEEVEMESEKKSFFFGLSLIVLLTIVILGIVVLRRREKPKKIIDKEKKPSEMEVERKPILTKGKLGAKICRICSGYLDKPSNISKCQGCGSEFHQTCVERTQNCPLCSFEFPIICFECGEANPRDSSFCSKCGTKL
ncbi:MAG: PQQ-binding-like beta-propeller repeat protein [Candidatus Methanofastidiosia archaeon]